jgi:uncharacterized membrane protein YgdD (TMEM256/DUF423 family)
MNWRSVGAVLMAVAVGLGAFGAHGLRGSLDEYSMNVYERGVFYHFIHALGILVVSAGLLPAARAKVVNALFAVGIVFFSGSLYVLAISGQRWLGAVTPIGGVAFIAAWVMLAWQAAQVDGERKG